MNFRSILSLSFLIVFLFACSEQQVEVKYRIAMVGDSITYNGGDENPDAWIHKLREKLGPEYEVLNFGVNGATALKLSNKPYWDQPEFDSSLASQADAVFIMLGTNDSKDENWRGGNNNFKIDYINFINAYKNLPQRPKIWVGKNLPAYADAWTINGDVIEQQIHPDVNHITVLTKTELVDLHKDFVNEHELFRDGIHPNVEGGKILALRLAELIQAHFEEAN
uniref:GDSL-type esterase/lipase family protein n=1 Tax=Ningiella ruwaisensis TaxID=2364274 RepID=UPI00109F7F6A|nr:GDSL-type esterase/lipase family protein [Ningiella ruwaisensis]